MKRQRILSEKVAPYTERRARIEAEPLPRNIAALVSEASDAGGDRLVWNFIDTGEELRYKDLKAQTHTLAAGFAKLGIDKGSHVAVMLPNMAALPLTWLALGTLGAVMVPVNTSYSDREVEYVLDDSDARFLVTTAAILPTVQRALERGKVTLSAEQIVIAGEKLEGHPDISSLMETSGDFTPPSDVDHDTLLNIQYTSGTTGFPKGCMLSQRFWLSAGKVNAFRDGRVYRHILAPTPFFYIDPQWMLLMALYHRATIFVAERQSATKFMGWVRKYDIDFCHLPYILLKQPADPLDTQNSIVKASIFGAPPKLHEELEARFDLVAREAFGMTEIASSLFVPMEATDMVGSGTCGIPCPFRECRVADENGVTVPPGTVGELLVRGPGILQGYYNRPDATKAAFHGEWFRTGDLFKMDEQGFFYIVGRIKDAIRRSGENISAREVETVITAHPDVAEVAVIPVKDDLRGEEIKSIIVWREGLTGTDEEISDLVEHCKRNLAPFKVPRFFETRASLPKTASNKVAKHLLVAEPQGGNAKVYDRSASTTKAPAVTLS